MGKPYVCPVCDGIGTRTPYNDGSTSAIPMPEQCPACKGACVLWEPADAFRPTDHPGFFPGVPVDPTTITLGGTPPDFRRPARFGTIS